MNLYLMAYKVKIVSVVEVLCIASRSRGMIGVLARYFYWLRGVATEAATAFRADDGRESLRLDRRESIHHDIFDPVGMATGTAAVFVPAAGNRIEGQELVHHRIGHRIAPQRLLEIICML